MATFKDYKVNKNWGIRPDNNITYVGKVWLVEKNEPYDLVNFSIEEIKGYYWNQSLCVKCNLSKNKIIELIKEFISKITDENIKQYKYFIEQGEKYGWN